MVKNAIKVYARLKPERNRRYVTNYQIHRRPKENQDEDFLVLTSPQKFNEYVDNRPESWNFSFFRIFEESTSQKDVFEITAQPIVESALDGYNGTIFAYGQTGSGKTYTITGDQKKHDARGIIPRSLQYLFDVIRKHPENVYSVEVAYLEIYNENGYDLLDRKQRREFAATRLEDLPRVTVQEDEIGRLHLKNLTFHCVESEQDAFDLLSVGDTNRVTADTPMNPQSSRSHCIFTIVVSIKQFGADQYRRAKVHLVDLAGSERVYKCAISGTILTEAKHINLSLHYLEQVIVCLGQESAGHIPYRNSMLTAILRDSLGGNCLTTMLATLSTSSINFEETISTCRFSQRVALIKNDVNLILESNLESENALLKLENARLKQQIEAITNKRTSRELTAEEKQFLDSQIRQYLESNAIVCWDFDPTKIEYCFESFRNIFSLIKDKNSCLKKLEYYKDMVVQRDKDISLLIDMLKKEKEKKRIIESVGETENDKVKLDQARRTLNKASDEIEFDTKCGNDIALNNIDEIAGILSGHGVSLSGRTLEDRSTSLRAGNADSNNSTLQKRNGLFLSAQERPLTNQNSVNFINTNCVKNKQEENPNKIYNGNTRAENKINFQMDHKKNKIHDELQNAYENHQQSVSNLRKKFLTSKVINNDLSNINSACNVVNLTLLEPTKSDVTVITNSEPTERPDRSSQRPKRKSLKKEIKTEGSRHISKRNHDIPSKNEETACEGDIVENKVSEFSTETPYFLEEVTHFEGTKDSIKSVESEYSANGSKRSLKKSLIELQSKPSTVAPSTNQQFDETSYIDSFEKDNTIVSSRVRNNEKEKELAPKAILKVPAVIAQSSSERYIEDEIKSEKCPKETDLNLYSRNENNLSKLKKDVSSFHSLTSISTGNCKSLQEGVTKDKPIEILTNNMVQQQNPSINFHGTEFEPHFRNEMTTCYADDVFDGKNNQLHVSGRSRYITKNEAEQFQFSSSPIISGRSYERSKQNTFEYPQESFCTGDNVNMRKQNNLGQSEYNLDNLRFDKSLPLTGDPEIDEEIIAFYKAKRLGDIY